MKKKFLVHKSNEYTYANLLTDLNLKNNYSSILYIKNNNPYEIFLNIIHSLLYGYSIEILDGDFSEIELLEIGVEQSSIYAISQLKNKIILSDFDSLLDKIVNQKEWFLTLYTSGTTGRPKKVSHTLQSLTRNVKISDRFKEDVWSFSYNPTHMAGLQVFFQAFYNKNTIIFTFDEKPKNMPFLIEKYAITHISATSTFYRNILPYFKKLYGGIKRVTFGGEKYDTNLGIRIKEVFPNAKISNIYASTEAGSLFQARGDVFEIKESIRDLVQINEKGQLLIHNILLGKSESFSLEGDWFITGDIVEPLDSFRFKFVGRQSELINVGGYKVNPIEIENTLITVPGVQEIVVKAKSNSVTGQIIVADVLKDQSYDDKELKKQIKKFASDHLQEWKVPRIINFVDDIPKSRTGKKVRK